MIRYLGRLGNAAFQLRGVGEQIDKKSNVRGGGVGRIEIPVGRT